MKNSDKESAQSEGEKEKEEEEKILTKVEKLQLELGEKKAENDQLEERIKIVKEEYDATIGNLMMVKKELNQKKIELDVAQRKHESILEKIRGLEKIKGQKKEAEFVKTKSDLEKTTRELEEMTREHKRVKEELERDQTDLHDIRKQQIDAKRELEEANSRLYNAKEELDKRDEFQDTGVLTSREKELIGGGTGDNKGPTGVIEAASAVVGSLKSKLNTAQRELDAVQNLLEKEREAHAETRKELDRLKSSGS